MEVQNQESMELQPQTQAVGLDFIKIAHVAQSQIESGDLKPSVTLSKIDFSNKKEAKVGNSFVGLFAGSKKQKAVKFRTESGFYLEHEFVALFHNNEKLEVPRVFVVSGVMADDLMARLPVGTCVKVVIEKVKTSPNGGDYFAYRIDAYSTKN